MLKMRGFRLLGVGAAVLAVAFVAAPAGAVLVGITAVTWDVTVTDPITDDANLASITAGTTYSFLAGATSAADAGGGAIGGSIFSSLNGTVPASPLAAVTDGLNATTGNNVLGGGVNFFFGQNIDGANLFFIDLGGFDDVTVRPIDGAGNLIGDFTLTTASDAGAGSFGSLDSLLNGGPLGVVSLQGVVFNTSDLAGTGTLTGAEGIRLVGSGFDTLVVGTASVIPEPSSLALLVIGTCGAALRRRRAC